MLLPLRDAQALLGRPGQIEHVLVSNRGDAESGAKLSDDVVQLLQPTLASLGLEADAEKRDGLAEADAQETRSSRCSRPSAARSPPGSS